MYLIAGLVLTLLVVADAQASPPSIQLPWGTYQALDTNDTFWHIPNVRFGKDTSLTRFQPPESPDPITDPTKVQDPNYGPACIQVALPSHTCSTTAKPGLRAPIPSVTPGTDSEDCLFLDIYFPKSVDTTSATTPVVVWLYGGAYVFGSKGGDPDDDKLGPLYTGQGLIEAAQGLKVPKDVIFVAGNYRLGAFGWLAGPTMQTYGRPNAGFYDQSAILSWVQNYIHLVGGDNTSVGVWGESAGASSILHHLVQQDGQPLPFQRALLQSPAFEWQWDNGPNGTLENVFNQFAQSVGCNNTDPESQFNCIQKADISQLTTANQNMWESYHNRGLFPFGPAVDDKNFTLLPPVALEQGKFKALNSIIISHVFNESGTFTPSDHDYDNFVTDFVPEPKDSIVVNNTISFYSNITDELTRLQTTIRDVSFTCNTRYLYDAYAKIAKPPIPVWMMQYGVGADYNPETLDLARHASDLLPAFWYSGWNLSYILQHEFCITDPKTQARIESLVDTFAPRYQHYLASYATSGTPNTPKFLLKTWNLATETEDGDSITDVLDFGALLSDNAYTDTQNTWTYCGFWLEQAKILQANVQARIDAVVDESERLGVQELDRLEL